MRTMEQRLRREVLALQKGSATAMEDGRVSDDRDTPRRRIVQAEMNITLSNFARSLDIETSSALILAAQWALECELENQDDPHPTSEEQIQILETLVEGVREYVIIRPNVNERNEAKFPQ